MGNEVGTNISVRVNFSSVRFADDICLASGSTRDLDSVSQQQIWFEGH